MSGQLVQHCFWVRLRQCFWKRLTFDSVDWLKQIAYPNVSGYYPTAEGLNRTKGRGKLPLFSAPLSELKHRSASSAPASQAFRLGLESAPWLSGSGLQTTPLISWTLSLQTDVVGPLSLHNCMSQYLMINLSACHSEMLTSWACSSCCLHILPACPDIPGSCHGRSGPEILKSSCKQKGFSFSPLSTKKWPFYITLVPWGPWK